MARAAVPLALVLALALAAPSAAVQAPAGPDRAALRASAAAALDTVDARLKAAPLRTYDSRKGTWVELETVRFGVDICPGALFPDGTYRIGAEMREKGAPAVLYGVDFYVRDGRVVDSHLRSKNGRDRLRGPEQPVGRETARDVRRDIGRFLEEVLALGGGELLLRDSRDPDRVLRLRLEELGEKVYRTEDGSYYLHADFLDANGVIYDLDVYAARERAGHRVTDLVIHRVAGTERIR